MDITKKVMREVEVINTDLIKVGDRLMVNKIKNSYGYSWKGEVINVSDESFIIKGKALLHDKELNCIEFFKFNAKDLHMYEIEKVEESQLSKFKVGDRYKIEDKLSGDTYSAEVISVGTDMVLKRDSGKHTIVQESQIGNTLLFYAIGGVVSQEDESDKEMSKEECEKKTDDFAKQLVDMIGLHPLTDNDVNRPFFVGYKPHYYFKTDCNSNNINTNKYV